MATEQIETTLSPCCASGHVHSHATPKGRVDKIGGFDTYIAEPPAAAADEDGSTGTTTTNTSTRPAVVFLSDIFGWEFPNTRLLADSYARAGFVVYLPDLLDGDALPISLLWHIDAPLTAQQTPGLVDKAASGEIWGAAFATWLPRHGPEVMLPKVEGFLDAVRALPGTGKVGTVGFCFGGRYSILMAGAGGHADAAYACHPTLVRIPADFEGVARPLSLAVGTHDSILDDRANGIIQGILDGRTKADGVPTELVRYQDQVHGFSLRSDWTSDKERAAMDKAEKQGVAWFKKHLA